MPVVASQHRRKESRDQAIRHNTTNMPGTNLHSITYLHCAHASDHQAPHPAKNLCQSCCETGMSALHSASSSGPASRMRKYSSIKGSEADRDGPNPYVRSIIP